VRVLGYNGFQGRTVHDIQFRGIDADAVVLQHLRDLVVQKTNEPLDSRKIRGSIQQLFATGRFANLQVEAEQRPDAQVSLVFIAEQNYFIGQMTVEGAPKRPTATQLLDASKLGLGQLFTPEKLDLALAEMKSVLADNGYYQAQVTVQQLERPGTQQMELHFHVVPGPAAKIGQVIVNGSPGIEPAQVMDIAHLHPGDLVSSERVTRALQRLRKNYQKQNRLEAQIAITGRVYHAENNTLDYVFNIVRGPRVDIIVEGASLGRGRLKKLVPVYEENAVDEDLLNEGRANLLNYFETQGYFDAKVDFQRKSEPGQDLLRVVYDVSRGDRHKLTDLAIEGNNYFPGDEIRERMQVQPAGLLLSHGRFSQEMLSRDARNIEALYRDNGYQQVKVTTEVKDDYRGEKDRMAVFLRIDEGPQTRFGAVHIAGNHSFGDEYFFGSARLEPLVNAGEGQPFSDSTIAQDRDSILNFYFNSGFPDVQLEITTAPEPGNPRLVDVTYTIKEGERVFVDRVLTSGLHYTRPWVVERDMKIHSGDPLSQDNMYRSQSAFYDLGIFNEVDMAVQNPEGRSRYKDVFFQFQEARRWTFDYGVGLEIQSGSPSGSQTPAGRTGASPRVSFDVSRINFRGRDHTLTFHSNVGRLQQRGLISYDAPRTFNVRNLRMTFTLLYDNSLNVKTFTSQRVEGSVQAVHTLTRRADGTPVSSLVWSFNYRRVRATELRITPEQIPLLSQPVRVGMPGLTYIRDKRDNPIDAHKGNYNTFDAGYAASALGSEASFGRMLVQNATYQPFGRKGRFVFARSTRIGIEEPTGRTTLIPLPERFFAGGAGTLRGFGLNQAGPRDPATGFPIGGGALFVNNLEMRFPPVTLPFVQDNVSFVAFHDFGNVFERAVDMFNSFGTWNQPNKAECRSTAPAAKCSFNYMSHAIGAGIRYRTPIGPVRVDIGYNLNPPTFPVRSDPVRGPHFENLGRFNFVFSIGQAF
jgi:outer membrane protein assembly complex protein YaeT